MRWCDGFMLSTTEHLKILLTKSVEDHAAGSRNDLHAFGYQFANLSPVPQELGLATTASI
jgi:hypothetical protein